MKKEKLIEYSPDNPLGWTEEEFRDIICQMVNIRILTGDYITPMLNSYYLNESDQWKKDKLSLTKEYFKEERKKELLKELEELND